MCRVLTVASWMAFSGMLMQGKEYMAPCTGLQTMPSTVLRTCSVSLAFSAKSLKVAVRSCVRQKEGGQILLLLLLIITAMREGN